MSLTTKFFEIRDSVTFIPVIATALVSETREEIYLLRSSGYNNQVNTVMVTRLDDCLSANSPFEWPNRTMQVAHAHIEANFHLLESGEVVDVQFILGETDHAKISQRLEVLR